MRKLITTKKIFQTAAAIVLCLVIAAPSFAASFAVTSPWVGVIAKFIAGPDGKVRSLSAWSGTGVGRTGYASANDVIIAIDRQEAASFHIAKNSRRLRVLYEKLPMTDSQLRRAFFDPAMLPFIAQSVMKIMADADKAKYVYYQRRLAEFQSRIDSTMDVGRYMLGKNKILDLTGAEGAWVSSAVASTIRPAQHMLNLWKQGDTSSLTPMLNDAATNRRVILIDEWTPAPIRAAVQAYGNRVTLPAPSSSKDYFMYLHDIFITVRDRAKQINSAPVKNKKTAAPARRKK
jgi:hypothetical protein